MKKKSSLIGRLERLEQHQGGKGARGAVVIYDPGGEPSDEEAKTAFFANLRPGEPAFVVYLPSNGRDCDPIRKGDL